MGYHDINKTTMNNIKIYIAQILPLPTGGLVTPRYYKSAMKKMAMSNFHYPWHLG